MEQVITCKLTGDVGKGVRAHIIPKSFYNLDYSQPIPLHILTNSDSGYDGKSFTGIYDSTIVTEKGERVFTGWDDYAHQLLVADRDKLVEKRDRGEVLCLLAPQYRYDQLKLFVLSVLWRASVSKQPFFSRVHLGPHEETIRTALLAGNAGDENFFSVTLACFVDLRDETAMMDPFAQRDKGVNYYQLYLGRYIAYIKVDSRSASPEMAEFALRPNSQLVLIAREFHGSKEKDVMRKMLVEKGR